MCCRVCNRRRKCGFKDTGFLKCVFNCSDHHQVNKYVENNYYYLKCNLRKSQSIRGRVIKRLNWFEQQNKSKLDFQSEKSSPYIRHQMTKDLKYNQPKEVCPANPQWMRPILKPMPRIGSWILQHHDWTEDNKNNFLAKMKEF